MKPLAINSFLNQFFCSDEGHVLVGGEESHELWNLDELELSTLGDIEVSEGSWEVGMRYFFLASPESPLWVSRTSEAAALVTASSIMKLPFGEPSLFFPSRA